MTINETQLNYDAFQFVEVQVPGVSTGQTGRQFNFPDLPYLRPDSADIVAVEVYAIAAVPNGFNSGNPNVSLAVLQSAALTLYGGINDPNTGRPIKQGNEVIQRVPLVRLNNIQDSTPSPFSRNIFLLNEMVVDWTKSFVNLAAAPANTVNWCFTFGVYFNYKKQFN